MKDAMEPASYWSLEFERGDAVSQVDLPLIIAGVQSLNPYDEKNGWMTLSKYSIERKLLGFTQTGASPEGYILEVHLKDGVCPLTSAFGKLAGWNDAVQSFLRVATARFRHLLMKLSGQTK